MTTGRVLVVLSMLVSTGVGVVLLRGETAKAANRIQVLHHRQLDYEQQLWAQEMELARLRGPEAIRSRAAELGLEVEPPLRQ